MIFLWGFCYSAGQECRSNICFHKATSKLPEMASKAGGLKKIKLIDHKNKSVI
ncbi:hypothetical protein MtrunA17_Chr2g0285021 [Medicago truncatula]|uniref:Uncharacterized protein n=1 Tax=Medicago truncatula TaxID=3880 RepID=A0A396J6Z7_MEDTR|nr:hypothetical protein MtrunA17_Chr2g0285021 [Medicago truncatula]